MRFGEFIKPWICYSLKNITERITRKNYNNETILPLTISAQYGLISQNNFFNKQIASKNMKNYYLLFNGEFSYNKSYSNDYPWGTVKRLDLYPCGALSSLYICFKPNEKINSDFLVHYFETSKWYKEISNIAGEGARNHGLLNMSVDNFFDTKHFIPDNNEQSKISKFLNVVNQRIQTQSKIIEDLELLKNGISNNVLLHTPQHWKQVRLSNILKERKLYCANDDTYPHATLSKDGVSLKTERYDRDFLVKDEDKQYKVTYINDICYNPANLKFGVICLNKLGSAIFSPIYVTYEISKNCNPYFIEQYLTNQNFINYIRRYEQGTVYERMAVNSEDFLKGFISLPKLEEQEKYAQIFKSIDNKIDNEIEILTKLKEQKKYLLSNMFI